MAAFPQGTCSTRAARDPLYISLHGLASVADEAALGLRAPIESTPVDLVHGADKEQYHTSPYTACDAIADETALRLRAPIVSSPGDIARRRQGEVLRIILPANATIADEAAPGLRAPIEPISVGLVLRCR